MIRDLLAECDALIAEYRGLWDQQQGVRAVLETSMAARCRKLKTELCEQIVALEAKVGQITHCYNVCTKQHAADHPELDDDELESLRLQRELRK
jgi:hypothetical protein